jgi:hypothetical protein
MPPWQKYSSIAGTPFVILRSTTTPRSPEVEFLEEIQTEVVRVFLLAIHRHLYTRIVLPTFCFFGLEISTSNSWEGGGGFWVNKYMNQ